MERASKLLIFSLVGTLGLFNVFGQGCGNINDLYKNETNPSSTKLSEKVLSLHPGNVYQPDESVFVMVDPGHLPAGSRWVWSHQFNDGTVTCDQDAAIDDVMVQFVCEDVGRLIVRLDVIRSDEPTVTHEVHVDIQ